MRASMIIPGLWQIGCFSELRFEPSRILGASAPVVSNERKHLEPKSFEGDLTSRYTPVGPVGAHILLLIDSERAIVTIYNFALVQAHGL